MAAITLLTAWGSTQYTMSTTQVRLRVSDGKPELDEKSGKSSDNDADGKKASVLKADVVQIIGR